MINIYAIRAFEPGNTNAMIIDGSQSDLWRLWHLASGTNIYPDGVTLAEQLRLNHALCAGTAVLSARYQGGCLVIEARMP